MKSVNWFATVAAIVFLGAFGDAGSSVVISVGCRSHPGAEISPRMFGVFFEDIDF